MTRRTWAFDIALAVAVGTLGQLEAWWGIGSTEREGPLWAQALVYAVTALLLVWRRVHPVGVLAAMVAAYLVEFAVFRAPAGYGVAVAPLVAIYTTGRYADPRRALLGLGLGVLLFAGWVGFQPGVLTAPVREVMVSFVWLSPWVVAWLAGKLVRITGLYRDQRRVAREEQASRAVAEERNRIARELHDVIGHSVSVMTVQASAVRRRLGRDQAVEREALEAVESVGREALAEMRRMVAVLREDAPGTGAGLEPPAGLAQVERLAEKYRSSGLPVSVSVSGSPRQLPPGLDLTAYRLLQEGLTNALRHARAPRAAEVSIQYDADRLRLAVRDDGAGTGGPAAAAGAGNGLTGMRERVAVYGGSLMARDRPEGGFELVATLPLEVT